MKLLDVIFAKMAAEPGAQMPTFEGTGWFVDPEMQRRPHSAMGKGSCKDSPRPVEWCQIRGGGQSKYAGVSQSEGVDTTFNSFNFYILNL